MILRGSKHRAGIGFDAVLELAESAVGAEDEEGYRTQFLELVKQARALLPNES